VDTVKVYVPAARPVNVPVVPLPVMVCPPGLAVTVQVPDDGRPLRATEPVDTVQVVWVMVPITGDEGAPETALIVTAFDATDVQPLNETVKV
jgi:hypothetical protein